MHIWKIKPKSYDNTQIELILEADFNLLPKINDIYTDVPIGLGKQPDIDGVNSILIKRHTLIFDVAFMYSERIEEIIKNIEYKLNLNENGWIIGGFNYDVEAHLEETES
jgi:hypothetical protein